MEDRGKYYNGLGSKLVLGEHTPWELDDRVNGVE